MPRKSNSPSRLVTKSGLEQEVERLHRLSVYGRWFMVAFIWLTVGLLSLWGLRSEISLWLEYFTWAAVRYGLAYHRFSTIGLAFCLGTTFAVLVWQTRNILFGLPQHEQQRLGQRVQRIRKQGHSHPLWQWVCREE
jgi:hypothetical protein